MILASPLALTNLALERLDKDHQAAQAKLERAPLTDWQRAKIKRELREEYQRRKEQILDGLAPAPEMTSGLATGI